MSSSASSRRTTGPDRRGDRRPRGDASASMATATPRSRRWTSTRSSPAARACSSTSSPTQRAGQPPREAVGGCRGAARAGIDVTSTLNIQHLESLNDVVERITGIKQRETIPDEIVRAAEQVEMVDITPEALRRRMVHGNIYAPDKIDASLANYFRRQPRGPARARCCGSPTRSTSASRSTANATGSPSRRPASASSSPSPGRPAPKADPRAARIAQRAHGERSAST